MGLTNRLILKNAKDALKRGQPMQVVAISKGGSNMPTQGEELIAMGYQLVSVTQTAGYFTWHFAYKNEQPTTAVLDTSHNRNANESEDDTNSEDIYGEYNPNDPIIRKAIEISIAKRCFSKAMLQTYLGKDRNYILNLATWLEGLGIIAPQNDNKPQDILIGSLEEFDAIVDQAVKEALADSRKSRR